MRSTIVIVTRNRREIAEQAISSALAQQGEPEVLLLDDGSTDGTADYFRAKYPAVRVERFEQQGGYIVRRNQAFNLARGQIIFSIDDDAVLTEPTIVLDILRSFDDIRVGAVAIPFVNCFDGKDHKDFADPPDDSTAWVKNTFIGTAFAIRRDVFLRLNGFRELFFHWGEESEFCQRLFAAGCVVQAGRSAVIRHYPRGAGKYRRKVNRYIYRNYLLAGFFNAPLRYLPPIIVVGTLRPLLRMLREPHTIPAVLEGLGMGFRDMLRYRALRKPIRRSSFEGWLAVRKSRFARLSEVQNLPAAQA